MSAQPSSSSATPQRYNVYKVRDGPVISDPDVTEIRYHTAIFVETIADGSGVIHHVTGDLVVGYVYETKDSQRPEVSETFHDRDFLGTVLASSYPVAFEEVLKEQASPPRQKAFNVVTMKTEPFKPDGTFYEPGEQRGSLVKCTEWTEQQAVPALLRANVLRQTPTVSLRPSSSASSA